MLLKFQFPNSEPHTPNPNSFIFFLILNLKSLQLSPCHHNLKLPNPWNLSLFQHFWDTLFIFLLCSSIQLIHLTLNLTQLRLFSWRVSLFFPLMATLGALDLILTPTTLYWGIKVLLLLHFLFLQCLFLLPIEILNASCSVVVDFV